MTQSMSYDLHLFDWSVPYCASIWPSPNVFIFSGNYFGKTLNCHSPSTVRAVDLIPKLRARPQYKLSSGTKYINLIPCDPHRHYIEIDTTQSSGPQMLKNTNFRHGFGHYTVDRFPPIYLLTLLRKCHICYCLCDIQLEQCH